MSSKISSIAAGICEAVWLAAVITVPLFFNVHSSRIFEPDKVILLRYLASIGLAAWIVRLIDEGWGQAGIDSNSKFILRQFLSLPLMLPILLLAASMLLSSLLSIVPGTSFFGSYQRMQGTVTFFSYLVIFFILIANLRSKDQLDRLLTTIVITSLPVAFYGVLQRYGLDPVPWGGNVQNRIAANMGNSIFAAAYLIMVVPVTAGKVVQEFRKILRDDPNLPILISRATLFVFILILNLIGIYLTGSRGPFLGLLAGLFLFFVLLSLYWRRRGLLVVTVLLAALLAILLLVINIPGGPLEPLRASPWVGRLGQVLDMNQRTSRVRTLIWQGAAELVLPHEPLEFPDGDPDPLNALRPLVGYGPESMYVAYNRFFPPELAIIEKRNASPDRSHNETWDVLVTNGILGFVIYQFLFVSIFYFGLKWLGMLTQKRQVIIFLTFFFGFGAVSGLVLTLWQGINFLGVGIPFGEIVGLVAFLTYSAIFVRPEVEIDETQFFRALILIVLLAGLTAHFVEIHFGIAIAATRLYFWVYTALLLLVGHLLQGSILADREIVPEPENEISDNKRRRRTRTSSPFVENWQYIVAQASVIAIVMITLAFDYLANLDRSDSILTIFSNSFFRIPLENFAFSPGIFGLLLIVWLIGGFLLTSSNQIRLSDSIRTFVFTLVVSLGLALPYFVLQSTNLATIFTGVPETQAELLAQVHRYAALPLWLGAYLTLLIAVLAIVQSEFWRQNVLFTRGASLVATIILLPAAVYVGLLVNFRTIQADIIFKQADPFMKSQQYGAAVLIYREAIELAPREDHYYLFLGRAYLEYAQNLQDPAQREAILQQAEQDLQLARQLNPLNTDHTANLARLYSWIGSVAANQQIRDQAYESAYDYYQQAVSLSPKNAGLWTEKAILELNSIGAVEEARRSAEVAAELDPTFDRIYALLGDYYVQMARSSASEEIGRENYRLAVTNYHKAVEVLKSTDRNSPALYTYYLALGGVYVELGELDQAINAYQSALQYPGSESNWQVNETLALLNLRLGNKDLAHQWVQRALQSAPESEHERLENLKSQIDSLP